jgi:formamidopyrimidine-DNA glycosylase
VNDVRRRGKFLLAGLSDDRILAINPKLTGAIQYCSPREESSELVARA